MTRRFTSVDEYIGSFPEDVRTILEEARRTIRNAVPQAEEGISYQIPTITLDGRHLVSFAAWKRHISLYPIPEGDEAFEREIEPYRAARSTVRFPLRQPIPYHLMERLVTLLVEQRAAQGEG